MCSWCGRQRPDRPAQYPDPPEPTSAEPTSAPPTSQAPAALLLPHGRVQIPDTPGLGGAKGSGYPLLLRTQNTSESAVILGLGEKPQVVGRHHWVQGKAPGRSWPKGTASQALPYKCSWRVCLSGLFPKVSNLGNRQKRPGLSTKNPWPVSEPCQSSSWPLIKDSKAKIVGLMDHWHLTPTQPRVQEDRKRLDAL